MDIGYKLSSEEFGPASWSLRRDARRNAASPSR